jgi:hypothetical protein
MMRLLISLKHPPPFSTANSMGYKVWLTHRQWRTPLACTVFRGPRVQYRLKRPTRYLGQRRLLKDHTNFLKINTQFSFREQYNFRFRSVIHMTDITKSDPKVCNCLLFGENPTFPGDQFGYNFWVELYAQYAHRCHTRILRFGLSNLRLNINFGLLLYIEDVNMFPEKPGCTLDQTAA